MISTEQTLTGQSSEGISFRAWIVLKMEINICTNAQQNSCERVVVNHLFKLRIHVSLSVPIYLQGKRKH